MASGWLGMGQDGGGALRIRPVVITGTVGDFVSQAAVVLRDLLADRSNEFVCGVQGADIGNDDVAPLIQLAKVGVTQGVGPRVRGAGPIPDGLLFFPIRTHEKDRRDSAAFV